MVPVDGNRFGERHLQASATGPDALTITEKELPFMHWMAERAGAMGRSVVQDYILKEVSRFEDRRQARKRQDAAESAAEAQIQQALRGQ